MFRSPSLPARAALAAILASPIVVKLVLFPAYPGSDDAFIHLRIADLLQSSSGWGINPGQWINMSTSPLFTLVLAGMDRVGVPPIGAGQALSALASSVGLGFLYLSARRLSTSLPAALFVTALAAINTQLWRWSGTVMEATPAFAAVAALLYLDLRWRPDQRTRRQWCVLGLVIGVVVLLRFELLLLLVLMLATGLGRSRDRLRSGLAFLGGASVLLIPYLVFAAVRLGGVVPTTFSAKSGGWHLANMSVLRPIVSAFLSAQPVIMGLVVIGVFLAVRDRRSESNERREHRALALWFVLGSLAFYLLRFSSLQSAGRYLVPMMAATAFLAAASLDPIREAAAAVASRGARFGRLAARTVVIGLVLLSLQLVALGIFMASNIVAVLRGYNDGYRAIATATAAAIGSSCSAGTRVLVEVDVGAISYEDHGRCTIVDGGGLADPQLARLGFR